MTKSSGKQERRGTSPPSDGPGSFDQPQSVSWSCLQYKGLDALCQYAPSYSTAIQYTSCERTLRCSASPWRNEGWYQSSHVPELLVFLFEIESHLLSSASSLSEPAAEFLSANRQRFPCSRFRQYSIPWSGRQADSRFLPRYMIPLKYSCSNSFVTGMLCPSSSL